MRIDLHDLLWNVFNPAGPGQVDIPLGIRHDHVFLHHGTGAQAISIKAVTLVTDDSVANSREAAADGHPLGLVEHHTVALPPSSIPLPRLPETMQVRIKLFPPVEVIKVPSSRFGAVPAKAKIPSKVLNEVNPL